MEYHVENSLLLTFFGLFLWLSLLNWFGLIILDNQFSPAEGWTCWLGQVGIIDNRRVIQREHWYLENKICSESCLGPRRTQFCISRAKPVSFKFLSHLFLSFPKDQDLDWVMVKFWFSSLSFYLITTQICLRIFFWLSGGRFLLE